MIKYFHELTETEFDKLVKQHMTWRECSELYPQPTWCEYPDAVTRDFGCWSLIDHLVANEDFCKDCEYYAQKKEAV